MRISVTDKQKAIGISATETANSRIEASLSKFGSNIVSVELFVEDINGPRGGIDKECRLIVHLRKMDDVAVSVKEETFTKAISRAIRRAERAVGRKSSVDHCVTPLARKPVWRSTASIRSQLSFRVGCHGHASAWP
jgi:hypothetical protein